MVAETNRYFANAEPWALRKTDPDEMARVLYVTLETLRQVAILAQPFMPDAMCRLLDQLGIAADARDFKELGRAGRIAPGTLIEKPLPVFPRYVESEPDAASPD